MEVESKNEEVNGSKGRVKGEFHFVILFTLGSGALLHTRGWRLWEYTSGHFVVHILLHHCYIHHHQCLYW